MVETKLVKSVSKTIPEQINILENIISDISKPYSEGIGIQDEIATSISDSSFDLSGFNTSDLNVFVLALITSGTSEDDGTIYRHIDNRGPLGEASPNSDLENSYRSKYNTYCFRNYGCRYYTSMG